MDWIATHVKGRAKLNADWQISTWGNADASTNIGMARNIIAVTAAEDDASIVDGCANMGAHWRTTIQTYVNVTTTMNVKRSAPKSASLVTAYVHGDVGYQKVTWKSAGAPTNTNLRTGLTPPREERNGLCLFRAHGVQLLRDR